MSRPEMSVGALGYSDLLDHLRKDLQLDPKTDILPLASANGVWQTYAAAGPWTAGSVTLQFMKDAIGFVHLRGNVGASGALSSVGIITLPVGYRPGVSDYYPCLTDAGAAGAYAAITTGGLVLGTVPAGGGQLWLNTITFLAEQ